jgi:hypothetical protein
LRGGRIHVAGRQRSLHDVPKNIRYASLRRAPRPR